jgi:formylglycine-generating enzyme required for sulfatase activity
MDMAGNVAEWVNDRYDESYYDVSPMMDPQGPDMGALRVIRGGGWNTGQSGFRVSARDANTPTFFNDETGFRCALDGS